VIVSDGSDVDGFRAESVRPFLRARGLGFEQSAPVADEQTLAVRSYLITGGRSVGSVNLEFESMLTATPAGAAAVATEQFEKRTILHLCTTDHLSVAELSARMRLPIGVVRVLAADLVGAELLTASETASSVDIANDTNLIARLIAGVRAL
jgi:hypothetical protein